ncbi:MAG: DUF5668 domain-containing protein [Candidatus Aminicenantales bacterium]|jgi:hypothetical protein
MAKQRSRDSLIWGIILIFFGGMFLLQALHVRVWHLFWQLWRFWPVILIVWGANKLYYGLKERGKAELVTPAPPQDKGHEI